MKTNWQTKKLGEICNFVRGPFGGSLKKSIFKKDGYAVYEQQHAIYDQFVDIRYFIDEKKFNEMKRFELESGDLIMSCSGTMGKIAIVPKNVKKGIINQALLKLKPSDKILPVFLKLWIQSDNFQNSLHGLSKGAAIHNVASVKILKQIQIPLPSLSEQQRIVKVLDEVFEKVAKAQENAEKNLANAKELFESYLQSIFANRGTDWEEKRVDEICKVEYGYTARAQSNGDFRFVRITDTDENGLLTKGKKMFIDSFDEVSRYILHDGDLLMARTGASAGNLLLFEGDERAVFASYLIRIKFKKEILSKLYWYFSKSKLYWDQVGQLSAGSAQPQFNGGALKQIIFPFPKSFSEQKAIVAELDVLSEQTKKLEAIYRQKLADLEELKKSVLKKAFDGEL